MTQDELQRRALMAQMAPRLDAGAYADMAGGAAADNAGTLAKLFGGKLKPSGASMGIGIAGEILGSMLKPKHDAAQVGDFGGYLSAFKRRMEGSGEGVLGGAAKWGGRGAQIGSVIPVLGTALGGGIGAAAGAIGNLFTRNAKSAYTDFTEADARQAIRDIYKNEGGRDVDENEVTTILKGQGWKPGSRWVGEKGMLSTLGNLRSNFAAERAQRGDAPAAPGGDTGGSTFARILERAKAIRGMDRNAIQSSVGRG